MGVGSNQVPSYLELVTEDTDISIINEFAHGLTLYPQQQSAIAESISTPTGSGIWTVEMGLGKTKMTVGIANLLTPLIRNGGLFIITSDSNTLESFYTHILENTDLKPFKTTGEAKKVTKCIELVKQGEVNCIICTHSAWDRSMLFNLFIYNNIERITAMVYDECKGSSTNQGFQNFIEAARYVKYVFPAHATPLNSGVQVIRDLLYAVKGTDLSLREFTSKYSTKEVVDDDALSVTLAEDIRDDFKGFLINFNRADVGAATVYKKIDFRAVDMTQSQRVALASGLRKPTVLYGLSSAAPAITQQPALTSLLQAVTCIPANESKVLFCRETKTKETITQLFSMLGVPILHLNGHDTMTPEEKSKAEETFNNTPGALMITSAYTGNNFNSADHIIVYETPPDVGQFIARIARGYSSKEINLTWVYYPENDKEDFYRAINSCIDNSIVTERDFTLALAFYQLIMRHYPTDPRNARLTSILQKVSYTQQAQAPHTVINFEGTYQNY